MYDITTGLFGSDYWGNQISTPELQPLSYIAQMLQDVQNLAFIVTFSDVARSVV